VAATIGEKMKHKSVTLFSWEVSSSQYDIFFQGKPMWVTLKDSFPLIESLHNHVMKTKPYLGSLGLRLNTKVCTLPE
jgi:hypothetical protein